MGRIHALILIGLVLACGSGDGSGDASALHVDAVPGVVRVKATIDRTGFRGHMARAMKMDGYHFLVWNRGGAAKYSLFTTRATDAQIHAALVQLSGPPGAPIPLEAWTDRHDEENGAPDRMATGTPLDIHVTWDGAESPISIDDLLRDPSGRGFDFVFTGNLENVPAWNSGCGICLVSCPGGKIGNAAYSVRDYVSGVAAFNVRSDLLPPDGSTVEILISLR